MTPGLQQRLARLAERYDELAREMADPDVAGDAERYARLSREYARLQATIAAFRAHAAARDELQALVRLLRDPDPELRALAEVEQTALQHRLEELESELRAQLVPRDPLDDANVFLEIRAGTGGDEAALFAGDLFRMYSRYAERRGWSLEVLSQNPGEHGGWREIISVVAGAEVYARLRWESGVHRVQRVPTTEAQGRIHTSAATVAVLPEPTATEAVAINPADLRIDTFRSSGAGGQHVNKTESAIRITHLPSGLVVECQEERSQHKNRARAMGLLNARLAEIERERQERQTAEDRRRQVGSGDRSERIRTYNFPQGRVTDHRIDLTLYQVERVIDGDLDLLVDPLREQARALALAALEENGA